MRHTVAVTVILMLLAACDHIGEDKKTVGDQFEKDSAQVGQNVEYHTMRVADDVRDSVRRTGERVRKWLITPPAGTGPNKPLPNSYCYTVYQDVLCYRQPMPGWEHRLVAYQGTHAAAPPAATTIRLPVRKIDVETEMESRVMNAAPVFNEMPAEVKAEEKSDDEPAAMDSSHEALPDPALAPQL